MKSPINEENEEQQDDDKESGEKVLNSVCPISQNDADNTFELDIESTREAEEGNIELDNSRDFDGKDDELLRSMKLQEERYSRYEIHPRSAAGCISILNFEPEKSGKLKNRTLNMKEK